MIFATLLIGIQGNDNGVAVRPPMGWRSWNCFHGDVSDSLMRAQVDALTKKRQVHGQVSPMSLLNLGFNRLGIDDGWQACGTGAKVQPGGTFHDGAGNPLVNKTKFPSLKDLTDYASSKGVDLGFYYNNCICHESASRISNKTWIDLTYTGDVQQILDAGFKGVKLDGCGPKNDLNKWERLINATGFRPMIEGCHGGKQTPTNLSWCPMHIFRSSNDIRAEWGSIMRNLHTTTKYQDPDSPLSRPGCWAYPDMMMVGDLKGPLATTESRSHFGAWAIVSSPLILGFDLTNETIVAQVWDFISNLEAIAINQNWHGHPGRLLNLTSLSVTNEQTLTTVSVEVWAKPQAHNAWAVLVINLDSTASSDAFNITLGAELGSAMNCGGSDGGIGTSPGAGAGAGAGAGVGVGAGGSCSVRDIWSHSDAHAISNGVLEVAPLSPHDSHFILISPQ